MLGVCVGRLKWGDGNNRKMDKKLSSVNVAGEVPQGHAGR